MKPDVRQKVLAFVAKYPGTRHKAFPFGHSYHFTAPGVVRMPFRLSTLNKLIAQGFVTKTGPVTLTLKGEYELAKTVPSVLPKGRVVYSLIRAGVRRNLVLRVAELTDGNREMNGAMRYPDAVDIVAHIRNMPKSGRQKVLRELVHELASQARADAEVAAKKSRPTGPTGYDSDKH